MECYGWIDYRTKCRERVGVERVFGDSALAVLMALKRLDLKVACQRANVPIENMVPFPPKTGKRKAAEAMNGIEKKKYRFNISSSRFPSWLCSD